MVEGLKPPLKYVHLIHPQNTCVGPNFTTAYGFHTNSTQTYLGAVCSAQKKTSVIDLELGKCKNSQFCTFSLLFDTQLNLGRDKTKGMAHLIHEDDDCTNIRKLTKWWEEISRQIMKLGTSNFTCCALPRDVRYAHGWLTWTYFQRTSCVCFTFGQYFGKY